MKELYKAKLGDEEVFFIRQEGFTVGQVFRSKDEAIAFLYHENPAIKPFALCGEDKVVAWGETLGTMTEVQKIE